MTHTTREEHADPAQADYEDWLRAKVAAARADTRQGMDTDQLRQLLQARARQLRSDLSQRSAEKP